MHVAGVYYQQCCSFSVYQSCRPHLDPAGLLSPVLSAKTSSCHSVKRYGCGAFPAQSLHPRLNVEPEATAVDAIHPHFTKIELFEKGPGCTLYVVSVMHARHCGGNTGLLAASD
ncbi:uncharacterized protein PV07_10070 [Cladophialophora immunda]|uniref:Uncharacterized protein n=1 Tax=Cladophialophora immunda TaxID=569365 RepID=A0A0D1Z9I9_9EURO|nr:uncharacterized protein PV07_10070 [Cladophialophora immunda]KIW24351.1 hypothetical protein PV07_10070 [Cladophialophora immunda]